MIAPCCSVCNLSVTYPLVLNWSATTRASWSRREECWIWHRYGHPHRFKRLQLHCPMCDAPLPLFWRSDQANDRILFYPSEEALMEGLL